MMELWPFTNFHDMNLDWIIRRIKNIETSEANAKASEEAAADYADDAKGYMQDAKSAKTQAAIFATQAGQKAEDAANSAASIAGVVNQVNSNTGRIDNLIATAGDGTIPSELTDIRVGYNGHTYATAGTAVRDQVATLHDEANAGTFVQKKFTVVGNTGGHSGTLDQITVNIPAGDKYAAWTSAGTIIVYFTDDSSINSGNSLVFEGTATKDIKAFGIYHAAVTSDVDVTFGVVKNPYGSRIITAMDRAATMNLGTGIYAIDLTEVVDANTLDKHLTWYSFGTATRPSNIPTSVTVGVLLNLCGDSNSYRRAQILFDSLSNIMYHRVLSGGTWSTWKSQTSSGSVNGVALRKTAANRFSIISYTGANSIRYDYEKCYKLWDSLTYLDGNGASQLAANVVSSDCWNNYYIHNNDSGDYIAQGNSNFIIKVHGEPGYAGDGHGNEVNRIFKIILDGAPVDFDNMQTGAEISGDTIKIITMSDVYKVSGIGNSNNYDVSYPALSTAGTPIVNCKHYMEISYEGENTTIHNRLIPMRNGISFDECHGAMLECQYTDFDTVICNNTENTINDVSDAGVFTIAAGSTVNLGNSAQRCDRVVMYGDTFYISQEMKNDDPSKVLNAAVYFNKYQDRLKCYFQPVRTYNRNITGAVDTFNTGDVISVTDKRQINL